MLKIGIILAGVGVTKPEKEVDDYVSKTKDSRN
jgi:hypothetical protein